MVIFFGVPTDLRPSPVERSLAKSTFRDALIAGIQMLIKRVRLHILAATAHGHNLSFDFTLAGPLAGFDRRGHSTWNPLYGTFRSLPRLSILITQHESTKSGASCTRSVWPDQLGCRCSTFASWTTCLSTYPFFLCLFLLFFSL